MTREQKYIEQLRELGIFQEAFEPEIHMLAMMERELQRTVKVWRENGSDVNTGTYDKISQLRKDILAHRDSLGLTPKGLHRLRPKGVGVEPEQKTQMTVLEQIRARRADA